MVERRTPRSKADDVQIERQMQRGLKGNPSRSIKISGRPRTQGDVDIEGLLRQIAEQNARIETHRQKSRDRTRRHRN
ncbi:hypothetical protein A2W45_02315 [Candidatus Curtissbacteria bacterium RIFCSPHIGHO2_12_41_11]|uniref:Uncharacterized protein n=2 Tax=Candidatus Curtissiibacteriota TaxID=1752717 RepID=A0A1F5HPF7_9BACT|nr:MAG: hypothetical protein A2Z54_03485 [Candidatus Curtissbacteria bacterium RIFCSPHIGHO2_02_39_8]OGD99011.1 MAG: hypothetical protein A2W45_02315 [Candidatus Curtissbacteria bacterium RIFCSPHIGHO2_12_41_11]OGE05960.1 MAG: hypothetical protein A2W70_05665 [Candidatus Curtissbacteria bacterium RIFCSPLOWO2_02_41_11]